MVHFFGRGDGIAQSLFSKFTAYQSLESTCIGLIGRKLYCSSDMPIQLAATNRLYHRPPCSLNNEYWLSVNQITTKNIYCRRKCQNMRKNMRKAHFAKICEKCGKMPNMRQSHIRVFLTCLTGGKAAAWSSESFPSIRDWPIVHLISTFDLRTTDVSVKIHFVDSRPTDRFSFFHRYQR